MNEGSPNAIPQAIAMTLLVTVPGATRTFPANSSSGLCLRMGADPTVATQAGTLRLAPLSLGEAAIMPVGSWRSLASREMSDGEFRSFPFSEFDTRLYSGTGSGHIRRPAALGLLLRFAPLKVPVPPKTNSLKRHRTPSGFLSFPSGKADLRHLGAGPTPAALPCVPRANRELKTENKHVSEQNHALRLSRQRR